MSSVGSGSALPKRYIPVGQGFVVQGDSDGGVISFTNSQRAFVKESDGESEFISRTASEEDLVASEDISRVYFRFTTPEGPQRQLLLGVKEGLMPGINYGYDAKMLDKQYSDCAFMEGDTPLVIQAIGNLYDNLELPLTIEIGQVGTCKFEAEDLSDIAPDYEVYFLDKHLNTYTPLESGEEIVFELAAGTYTNRFYIVFKEATALAIVEENLDDNLNVFYTAQNNTIVIHNPTNFSVRNIQLHNVLGQEVLGHLNRYHDVSTINLAVGELATGTYILTFMYNDSITITKKMIIR